MKHYTIILIGLLVCSPALGQNFVELANYEFKTAESYQTEKGKVLAAANYLLDNPSNQAELIRLSATQYLLKWMEGTPDYTFHINKDAVDLTKGNSDLLGLYFAAMTKVVLEDANGTALTEDEIYNKSEGLLVDYCANPDNKMKPSKKIKKILKSRD